MSTLSTDSQLHNELPRELVPGLFWLGQCALLEYQGSTLHAYNSVYVVAGEEASVVVEAAAPFDRGVVQTQIDRLLDEGLAPIKYVFTTHAETNHSSGTGDLLERFPDACLIGDPTDIHLTFPRYVDRIADRPPRVSALRPRRSRMNQKIKLAQKVLGCRHSSGGGP